ncbi:MAG TPA: methylated-DNA--[protein]-cysteine S-methyltransferase [Casimicrobiaceae bacterium]|nr:methylated-DNA--[protein]-cysteine S-methyltransferase [Casimicrobiaceae bacterium]
MIAGAKDATRWAARLRAPFATLGVRTDGRAVTRLAYLARDVAEQAPTDRVAERALRELARYLDDSEFVFTVPLAPGGTPFQRMVWDAIRAIPLRESRTYGEIAHRVRSAPRAIGQACGANRIALIIPCHRVVGSRGALGGFMGAADPARRARSRPGAKHDDLFDGALRARDEDPLAIKRWLLAHEGYRFGA